MEDRENLPRVTREEAIRQAGEIAAEMYLHTDSLTVEEAAREAYTPTGPSVAELEADIRADRARRGWNVPPQ